MPLSLTLWEHIYALVPFLIVQETADTFGLVCIGLLFLSAQIFSRNLALSVFKLSATTSNSTSSQSETTPATNNVKALPHTATSVSKLESLPSLTTQTLRKQLGG